MQTDLTLFTNEPGSNLLDRFRKTLKDVKFFDVLVGYFRTSGFYNLQESFTSIDKVRILVGLNVDRKAFEIIDTHLSQSSLDFESHKRTKEIYSETVTGGRIRFFTQSMELIPILHASDIQKSPIIVRVPKSLANPDSPAVPQLEVEIDRLVYELYGLTEEEIALMEGKR